MVDTVHSVFNTIKKTNLYKSVLHQLQNDFVEQKISADEDDQTIKEKIQLWLVEKTFLLPIKNEACKLILTTCNDFSNDDKMSIQYNNWKSLLPAADIANITEESLEIIGTARTQWDTRLRYQLRTLSAQQKRPLIQTHNSNDAEDTSSDEVLSLRYIYTCEDLLETLANIINPN